MKKLIKFLVITTILLLTGCTVEGDFNWEFSSLTERVALVNQIRTDGMDCGEFGFLRDSGPDLKIDSRLQNAAEDKILDISFSGIFDPAINSDGTRTDIYLSNNGYFNVAMTVVFFDKESIFELDSVLANNPELCAFFMATDWNIIGYSRSDILDRSADVIFLGVDYTAI